MRGYGGPDRRRTGRRKLLRAGTIIYGARDERMKCAVLDLGDDSAKLKRETHGVLPNTFRLQLHAGEAYACTVVRRSGYLLAVKLAPVTPGC